jgi:hypothetical protein
VVGVITIVGGRGLICELPEVRCGEYPGDVIVDLEGSVHDQGARFVITVKPRARVTRHVVNRLMINGAPSRTMIGLGELEGEAVVRGINGENYGVRLGDSVVIYGRPLSVYLIHKPRLVVEELLTLTNSTGTRVDEVIDSITKAILSERRSRRISMVLAQLEEVAYGKGDPSNLPTHILDALASVGALRGGQVDQALMRRIMEGVKSRVYPR